MKQLKFHSDFASVTVCVNGQALALHGEVDVSVKEPSKLAKQDKETWAQLNQKSASSVSVEQVPAEGK